MDVSTLEAVGLKHHCGNKGCVSGRTGASRTPRNQAHDGLSAFTQKGHQRLARGWKYPRAATLAVREGMRLPGATAVTDNIH